LADRLVGHFTAQGFQFTGKSDGDTRALTGVRAQCGTTVTIDTGESALYLAPGARGNMPPGWSSNGSGVGLPGAPTTTIPGDPTVSTVPGAIAGPSVTESSTPGPSTSGPVTVDPSQTLPQPPLDPSGLESGSMVSDPSTLTAYMQPNRQGAAVMIASQQARAVVPKALEGRC
jgi:hypothetical protein